MFCWCCWHVLESTKAPYGPSCIDMKIDQLWITSFSCMCCLHSYSYIKFSLLGHVLIEITLRSLERKAFRIECFMHCFFLIMGLYIDVTSSIHWCLHLLAPLILFLHGAGWVRYSCITWVIFIQILNVDFLSFVQLESFSYHLSMSFFFSFKPSTLEMTSLSKHLHVIVDPPYVANTSKPTNKREGRLHTLCYTNIFDDQCTWM